SHLMTSSPKFDWKLYGCLIALTIILVLQNTKQAMLPAKQTPVLWTAEIVVIVGVLVLRSGWARDNRWAKSQAEIGTLANNFYEPRREVFSNGFAIGGGVFCSIFWALATWAVVLTGLRRGVVTRGLADFEVAAVAGAISGGVFGAVVGLVAGHLWETRHRRKRLSARAHA
ncbi:MAG: hypothetical protein ACREPM_13990, partial [Gemmatimonadaceae bacterium]